MGKKNGFSASKRRHENRKAEKRKRKAERREQRKAGLLGPEEGDLDGSLAEASGLVPEAVGDDPGST